MAHGWPVLMAMSNGISNAPISVSTVEQALSFILADDRDTWIECGMAIKAELGEAGFDAWDRWSATADNYRARAAAASWKSFKASGGVGIGTLLHHAKQHGYQYNTSNKPAPPTPEELAQREAKRKAEADLLLSRRTAAADKAVTIWNGPPNALEAGCQALNEHRYLKRKGIQPHGTKIFRGSMTIGGMDCNGALMIPMQLNGKITSLQFINSEGEKRFLPNGEKGGYLIGKIEVGEPLCIAEGFATGASIHESTGHPVIVAFDAGNLRKMAEALRAKNPDAVIVLCADDDETGSGQRKATEAAQEVGGLLAMPVFGEQRLPGVKDFNDMATLTGLEAVKQAIDAANPVEQKTDPAGFPASDLIKGGNGNARPDPKNAIGSGPDGRYDALEPEPLRAKLPSSEPYPVDALGDILGAAARAINKSVKAPLALCCQSVLAAASLAAQAHFDIKLPWGERKPLSLFFLTVGESGERKTGVDDLVLGAAKVQERADMEANTLEQAAYETELAAWTQATDAARKAVTSGKKGSATAKDVCAAAERCGDKPVPPIAPLRFVSDPTVEGLYKLLVTGQPSVALFSDEGGLLIGGHALNSDNALKTMARWCKLWDGSPFDRVRAGDGAGVLYGRRMALHQLAQPDVMTTLLSDRMANGQGLLARCLVAWPESTIGTRHIERYEWAGDRHELKRLFAVFKGLMEAEPRAGKSMQELDPVELPLTDEAKSLAMAASNQFETLMARGADLAELRDRTSKAVENACRIAGVIAVIEGGLSVRAIDTGHLERALVLVQWYLSEALRIRGAAAIPQSVIDAELLSAWLRERGFKQFRSKQVLRSGPNQLRNKTRLTAATSELVTNGYLAENEKGTMVDEVAARKSWRVLHHVV